MAREEERVCRSTGRTYRAVGMVVEVGLRSKQGRGQEVLSVVRDGAYELGSKR